MCKKMFYFCFFCLFKLVCLFAVKLETFSEESLGKACSSSLDHSFLIYQPNYDFHWDLEHGTQFRCQVIKRKHFEELEREALLIKLNDNSSSSGSSDLWKEVPPGSLLAAPDPEDPNQPFTLLSYQPILSTSTALMLVPVGKIFFCFLLFINSSNNIN